MKSSPIKMSGHKNLNFSSSGKKSPSSLEIKEISAGEALPIRQAVLRKGKPLTACVFEGDEQADTFHLGAFEERELLGIVTLMANKNAKFSPEDQYQLRGMAVMPNARKKGLARLLLEKSEELLLGKNIKLLWCNARKKAVGFYAKQGFETRGESFEIPQIGTHFLMYKIMGPRK